MLCKPWEDSRYHNVIPVHFSNIRWCYQNPDKVVSGVVPPLCLMSKLGSSGHWKARHPSGSVHPVGALPLSDARAPATQHQCTFATPEQWLTSTHNTNLSPCISTTNCLFLKVCFVHSYCNCIYKATAQKCMAKLMSMKAGVSCFGVCTRLRISINLLQLTLHETQWQIP